MVQLVAKLFGDFKMMTSLGVPIAMNNRRAGLIFAILCLQPQRSIDRAALAKLLWPDRFDAQAKASLRQCLLDLRKSLEEHGITSLRVTRAEVAIEPCALTCDLFELETQLEHDPERASESLLEIGNRSLLQGTELNTEFDMRLEARREHTDARMKAAVRAAISAANPAMPRRLLEASKARFPTIGALGLNPTQTVIGILPFHHDETLSDGLFLADGVVDELSSRLGGVDGVALVGRASIATVAEQNATLPQMAAALGASHLIEGCVRLRGEQIEVRIALIEGASGTELWTDRVIGAVADFFDARRVIGSNVIASMSKALGLALTATPSRKMTADRKAYRLYLQGRAIAQRFTSADFPKAIELMDQALDIDPYFAECWTALADAHIMLAATTPTLERAEHTHKGAACAQKALELDPRQAHAYSVLGVTEWCQFNPARALDLAYEAYALDPNDADVASRLGSTLLYLGKSQDGLPFVQAAVDLDPANGRNYVMLASAYLSLGEIEKAHAAAQSVIDLGGPRMWMAIAQYIQGDCEGAVQSHYQNRFFLGTTIMRPPGMPPMDDIARDAYFKFAARGTFSGEEADRAAYCQMLDGLHAAMPDPHDTSIVLPAIWMGHADLVMKIYSERIHPANIFGLIDLWIDAEPFNATRLHPDFMDFADKTGMTDAWDRHGWPDLMPYDLRKR